MAKNIICKLSKTSAYHYWKLISRSLIFVFALIVYIIGRTQGNDILYRKIENKEEAVIIIWVLFVVEMIFRFFPSKLESMGCQKQFEKNYKPKNVGRGIASNNTSSFKTFLVAAAWISLNAILAALFFLKIIDKGAMLLISLAYVVSDMICILFFCPFHTFIMRNKCCTTCRIYNWDYAMMFTPLIFVPSILTWSLVIISLLLLIKWEVIYKKHPERFAENTNSSLDCENCKEKLCYNKKQLQSYLKKWKANTFKNS